MTDILAEIDATVDGRCACGCGVLLAPDGPSGWFASEGCQLRFQAREATAPVRVPLYEGRDLSREERLERVAQLCRLLDAGYVRMRCCEAGTVAWPEPCPWHSGPPVSRLPVPEPPSTWDRYAEERLRREEGWSLADSGPVSWTRWCAGCSRPVQPRTGIIPLPFTAASPVGDPGCAVEMPEITQHCPRCRCRWPGPRLLAQWREDEACQAYVLRLAAPGWGWITHRLEADTVEAAYADVVAWAWRDMERTLLDGLTFRAACAMPDCQEKARARFRVRDGVTVLGSLSGEVGLCPGHESDLWRAQDEFGTPMLWYQFALPQPVGSGVHGAGSAADVGLRELRLREWARYRYGSGLVSADVVRDLLRGGGT